MARHLVRASSTPVNAAGPSVILRARPRLSGNRRSCGAPTGGRARRDPHGACPRRYTRGLPVLTGPHWRRSGVALHGHELTLQDRADDIGGLMHCHVGHVRVFQRRRRIAVPEQAADGQHRLALCESHAGVCVSTVVKADIA